MSKELQPPRDLRKTMPRTCHTCKHAAIIDGTFECKRPNGPSWDVGDGWHYVFVCDLWVAASWTDIFSRKPQ